jgi:hypothetical protein
VFTSLESNPNTLTQIFSGIPLRKGNTFEIVIDNGQKAVVSVDTTTTEEGIFGVIITDKTEISIQNTK